ncbi:ubiquitin-conjugating enzyme [Xylona heveae TC161]|uniref:Ubiquitin-conjugating enzyme n=1 Tax=Xylona heveae (strain CBS 132557 / TC161) TaxID=1328760 RepID=A0A165HML8_XYLHT|nr:ubiquitin-conjugating enzyme [Xylona heveae TC161]KZF23741.1 ubiquitin-conjugating enzyme [Xylona heveae TC161]
MSNQSIIRITRELSEIQKTSDLSIAVACQDVDVRNVRALIIGPPETPYEFGFFEFSLKFGKEYPGKAPLVLAITTNGGRCRFNPNIYAGGKVCLSILGTWSGERGEEWSSAQGLESILISIQSLMSANPYENEPGFEDAKSEYDKKSMKDYIAKIRHETLRVSVIQRLEEYLGIMPDGTIDPPVQLSPDSEIEVLDEAQLSFEPFRDLCKRRFIMYYDSYLQTIAKAKISVSEGQQFAKMPFEGTGNSMDGKFLYSELERRVKVIRTALDEETHRWATEGILAVQKELGVAHLLQRQYEQIVESYKRNDTVTMDIGLIDNNPFVWQLTYFGRPMTNLDGGLFRIKAHFSPRFPDEQPRVIFETHLFHHRISKDGVLCYFPHRQDEVKSHIEAIIEAIEEDSPPYDPRTLVNPEASKLFWGSAEDKKNYNRRLRRSVQRSME